MDASLSAQLPSKKEEPASGLKPPHRKAENYWISFAQRTQFSQALKAKAVIPSSSSLCDLNLFW